MQFKVKLLMSSYLYTWLLLISSTSSERPDLEDIRNVLLNPNDTDRLTYQQLQVYFEYVTGVSSTIAAAQSRLFPLCIDPSTLESSKVPELAAWAPIWRAIDKGHPCEDRPLRFYEFNESEHSMLKNRDWIENITITRINTDEVDARNMRQWMHIRIDVQKNLQGVYLQTIVGSMGLPSGNFNYDFPCYDFSATVPDDSADFTTVHPCDYRSRAELNHPNAFFGGHNHTISSLAPFHVHYKWTDISCLETPFLQFIVVAVADFKSEPEWGVDFQPLLSPVYSNVEFDSKDGVMTPFYVDWEKQMYCFQKYHLNFWSRSRKLYHDTEFQPLKWRETTIRRVNFNEDYEQCITGKDTNKRDESRKECRPGPFECPEELNIKAVSDAKGFQAVVDRREAEVKEAESSDCIPCVFPSKEELNCSGELGDERFSEKNHQRFLHLDYSEYLSSALDSKIHGAMSILVYCVLVPVSVMIVRFYRGTSIRGHNKDDMWIMIHVGIQCLGYLLMWISTGFVSTLYEGYDHTSQHCLKEAEEIVYNSSLWDNEWTQDSFNEWLDKCTTENRSVSHSALGIVTFVIHNLIMIISFSRSRSDPLRNIQVIIHSHLGYLIPILSAISIYFAVSGEHCTELLEYTIIMAVINVLGFLIASCVITAEDKALKIEPRRYKWPILEPIRLSYPGPCHECKVALLSVYAGSLVFVWILAVVALSRITVSEDKALGGVERGKIIHGIFKSCKSPSIFRPRIFT